VTFALSPLQAPSYVYVSFSRFERKPIKTCKALKFPITAPLINNKSINRGDKVGES